MTITMVTSSYPRFPATRRPPSWNQSRPASRRAATRCTWSRPRTRCGVGEHQRRRPLHLYRYAPSPRLNTFGYATAMRADVRLPALGDRGRAARGNRRLAAGAAGATRYRRDRGARTLGHSERRDCGSSGRCSSPSSACMAPTCSSPNATRPPVSLPAPRSGAPRG